MLEVHPTMQRRCDTNQQWQGLERGSAGYRRILIALMCAGVATFAQLYALQGVLPLLAADLGRAPADAALAVSSATLGLALAVIGWSMISDRFGRRRTMIAAVTAATVLGGAANMMPTFELIVGLRFLEGAALGGIPAVAMAYLAEEVSTVHAAVAAGSYISGTSIGGLSGRMVAAPIGELFGWRAGALAVTAVAVVATVAFFVLAPRQRGFHPQPLQPVVLARTVLAHLRDVGQVALYLQGFLLMGSFVATYNYLGFHLGEPPFGISQALVSLLFLAYLSGTWSSAWAGSLTTRFGRRPVLIGSAGVMMVGLLLTLIAWLPAIIMGLVVFTAGFFAAHSVANGWVPARARAGRAQASSLYTLFYYGGSSVLGWATGLVFVHGWGAVAASLCGWVALAILAAVVGLRPNQVPQ